MARPASGRRRWRALRIAGWVVTLAVTVVLAVQLWYFARVLWWSRFDPGPTSFMRQELARLRQTDPDRQLRHDWVPYARI